MSLKKDKDIKNNQDDLKKSDPKVAKKAKKSSEGEVKFVLVPFKEYKDQKKNQRSLAKAELKLEKKAKKSSDDEVEFVLVSFKEYKEQKKQKKHQKKSIARAARKAKKDSQTKPEVIKKQVVSDQPETKKNLEVESKVKTESKPESKSKPKKETEVEIIKKHGEADQPVTEKEEKTEKKARKEFKERERKLAKITKEHSKEILEGKIVSIANNIPNTEENIIELFDVKKSYLTGDLEYEVLKGVNLAIKKETFVVILGPSGSGKTTLLNIISGLDKANQGDVFVSGYNLSLLKDSHLTKFRRDNVGFIFQQYNLLTNLTARENAEVGENLAKTKNKALGIDEIFKVIEMDAHMNKFPSQLSGGQQQRVSIGRALAKNPKILFCDEPTGALDEEMGRKVLEILLDVNKAFKTSVIMVTHNPNFQYVADIVINVRNGIITSVKHNNNPKKPSEINWG